MEYQSSPELIQAISDAKNGDERAVALLFRAFNPPLLRYLRARSGIDAEDISSGVWLSVAKNIATFRGDDRDFRSWIFATARRRTIDLHRRLQARPRIEGVDDFYSFADRREVPALPDQLEIDEAIAQITQGLSGEQVEVLLLRIIAGLSAEEVARITAKSATWVRVTQHRAIKYISKRFSDNDVTPEQRAAFSKEL